MRAVLLGALAAPLALAVALGWLTGDPAAAQAGEAQQIRGVLEVIDADERRPVGGVEIVVGLRGAEVGRATSGPDGRWEVPVPEAGTYSVRLLTGTLPAGVALTNPDRVELNQVEVSPGRRKTVRFGLGPGAAQTVTRAERISNLAVLGFRFGAIIALSSVGLSLVYGIQRFADSFYAWNPFGEGTYGFSIASNPLRYSERRLWVMVVCWGLVIVATIMIAALVHSPWGRALRAIREDEEAARSLGENVFGYKSGPTAPARPRSSTSCAASMCPMPASGCSGRTPCNRLPEPRRVPPPGPRRSRSRSPVSAPTASPGPAWSARSSSRGRSPASP